MYKEKNSRSFLNNIINKRVDVNSLACNYLYKHDALFSFFSNQKWNHMMNITSICFCFLLM